MTTTRCTRSEHASANRMRHAWLCLAVALAIGSAHAAEPFTHTDFQPKGRVFAGGAGGPGGGPLFPGGEALFRGMQFTPGQTVMLSYGGTPLLDVPATVDAEGNFSARYTLPAAATTGLHPVVVEVAEPVSAQIVEVKVSPNVPRSGEDRFDITAQSLVPGLYQAAYSAKNHAVFVTSAVGRPPVTVSELVKVDADTLAITARITPAKVPGHEDERVFAVYGVGIDDRNDTVWVTNTRDNTVAVYRQSDLSLLRQFTPGQVPHSRDVIVDERRGMVYATATGENYLSVFDAKSLAFLRNIEIGSNVRGEKFIPMSLELDIDSGKLFTVSLRTPEAAVIDTTSNTVEKLIALGTVKTASGVAYDAGNRRLLVASQGTDNLVAVNIDSGEIVFDLPVGAGPLNVAFDPVHKLAYVANRGSGTTTVVDADGRIVANLDSGTFPNHVHEDGKGSVFAINKSRGEDDPSGDRIAHITPKPD